MARSSPVLRRSPGSPPGRVHGPQSGRARRRVAPAPAHGPTLDGVCPERAFPAAAAILGALAALLVSAPRAVAQQPEPGPEPTLEERARAIHEEALVFDGHNDLPWRIRDEAELDLDAMGLDERLDEGHTDLVRLREGGIDAQFWSVYVPADADGDDATETVLEQIDLVKRMADRYPGHLEMAYSADDVVRIASTGRTASLLGAEGGHAIANSLPVLRELYRAGVRYMTLTHSGTLAWADAVGDTAAHGGLTDFGRRVVREMNRLGMLVDLSHVTDDVMRDVLEVSEAPVIFSHSSARAVADHDRNVPDDLLRAVAENGGVVMVTFVSGYLTPEGAEIMGELFQVQRRLRNEHPDPEDYEEAYRKWREENPVPPGDVATVADHVDHIVDVAGVDHVGIGSDWDGTSTLPEGLKDVSELPNLTEELLRRGYSEVEVEKILGGNVLRVMRDAEATAARLEGETPPVDRLPQRGFGSDDGGGGDR